MIYVVSYGNHDEYVPDYLESSENLSQQEFTALAKSLLPQAEERALKVNHDMYVGWREIAQALLAILLESGRFKPVPPMPEVLLFGRNIIEKPRDAKYEGFKLSSAVIKHNERINDEIRNGP